MYWQIGTELCNPAIRWAQALTVYEGQLIAEYSTGGAPYNVLRHQNRTRSVKEKVSIIAKIKDTLGISGGANFSITY